MYWPTIESRSYNWKQQVAWAMDGYILPDFGDRPIGEVERHEWQGYFNRLAAKRVLNASSVAKVKIVISGVYNLAEDDGAVAKNPVRNVRLAPAAPANKRVLTFEELGALLNVDTIVKPFVILAGCCGLRRGEALATQRNFIENGVLRVCQQVIQPKGGCIVTTTLKTPQSHRRIPVPMGLEDALTNAGQKSAVFLCSDTMGGYLTPSNTARELNAAWKQAGIGKVSPHELRHTFVSLMENELEAPRVVVEELTGKAKGDGIGRYSKAAMARKLAWMDKFWEACRTSTTTTLDESSTETA